MERVCAFVLSASKVQNVLFCSALDMTKSALNDAGISDIFTLDGDCESSLDNIKDMLKSGADFEKVIIISQPLPAITDCSIDKLMSADNGAVMYFDETDEFAILCADSDKVLGCGSVCEMAGMFEEYKPLYREECLKTDSRNLSDVTKFMQWAINERLAETGVIIMDKENVYISPECDIESGVTILPNTIIRGKSTVKSGAVIGPNTILEDAYIENDVTVNSSQIYKSKIGEKTTVGPFAYIRPDCTIGKEVRIGDFVELKKTNIGNNTKISHLTYLGDAEVGERVNFGCGCVTANYDGKNKYKTIIGNDAFIGCNTNMVAPVNIGNGVYTAAGSTVTEDVPDNALLIARAKEVVKENWVLKNVKK